MSFSRDEVLNLEYSFKKEYLLTNGAGAYASSTIVDCHTRKYHGLLVVPIEKYGKLYNLLSKIEAVLSINNRAFHLSTNKHPGVFAPTGHQYIESFSFESTAVTTYKIGDITVVKTLMMPQGKESILIRYDIVASPVPLVFKLSPLLAYREIHLLSKQNMSIRPRSFPEKNGFKIDPYEGMPQLIVETSTKSNFFPSPTWWNDFEYLKERNRGYEYQEDLFCPGVFEIKAKKGDSFIIRATTHKTRETVLKEWAEGERAIALAAKSLSRLPEPLKTLKRSAAHYTISYAKRPVLRAGYHWYRGLGRDTMLSLPGLLFTNDDKSTAIEILKRYAKCERDGLLPDILDIGGEQHIYNNADVSLLFVLAVQKLNDTIADRELIKNEFHKVILKIISDISTGKARNIRVDSKGFMFIGDGSQALTWMNGYSYGRPATPRNGAPVEINALWYNALRFAIEVFSGKIDPHLQNRIENITDSIERNFMQLYWCESTNCLADRLHEDYTQDRSIRPNQLFATSLPYSPVPDSSITPIVTTVRNHLITPLGFRTLSPSDSGYRPHYVGSVDERDAAAHQGMIYPWLTGLYMDSLMKVFPPTVVAKEIKEAFSTLWEEHLTRYGLFQISEMFVPNPPYIAKGCIGHALNLAEISRVLEVVIRNSN